MAQVSQPDPHITSEREWLEVRAYLRDHRHQLAAQASQLYPEVPRVAGTPLLTAPGWVPPRPIPLDRISVDLDLSAITSIYAAPALPSTVPLRSDGQPYRSYSDAVAHLDSPAVLDNRVTYRLQEADLASAEPRLKFTVGRYFDALDTGAARAHEYAALQLSGSTISRSAAWPSPVDLTARPTNVAVTALTIVHDQETGDARFLLHWRDPEKVAHAGGLYQAIPAGVFQPATDSADSLRDDLSVWRCLMREYSEELLGEAETDAAGDPVDYDHWPFAVEFTQELRRGGIRGYCVGLGVDPLTFATDLLCVVVIDAPVFGRLFNGLVTTNAEGELVKPTQGGEVGLPFVASEVDRLTGVEPMQAAGAAVLRSAWRYRDQLLQATRPRPTEFDRHSQAQLGQRHRSTSAKSLEARRSTRQSQPRD